MYGPIYFPIFGENFSVNPCPYFELFGYKFYWYGMIIAIGFILAVAYCLARKKEFGLTEDNILDMLLIVVPSAIIGARLYYVVFNFSSYRSNLWEIFMIWHGGIAIYGAVIFGALAAFIFARVKKLPVGTLFDIAGLGLLIGQACGRWGNFMNREAYGAVTDVIWRMGITLDSGAVTYVHPTFFYESMWNVIGFILLHFWSKKHRKYDGQIFIMYAGWYGLGRAYIEGLRSDSLYLFNTGIRVSQLVAIVTVVIAAALLIINRNKHDKSELFVNRIAAEKNKAAENPEGQM